MAPRACPAPFAAALAVWLTLPVPAAAEAACSEIPDDADRLACYDRTFGGPPEAGWAVWRETSAMDGSAGLVAARAADAPVADRFGTLVRARLHLACREGALAVWIHFGGAYFDDRTGGDVTYRLGEAAPANRAFQVAADRRSLGFWSDRAARLFLAELDAAERAGAARLVVRAQPFRTRAATVAFELSGLAEPLARVRGACDG
jgi:hypothetical protein